MILVIDSQRTVQFVKLIKQPIFILKFCQNTHFTKQRHTKRSCCVLYNGKDNSVVFVCGNAMLASRVTSQSFHASAAGLGVK